MLDKYLTIRRFLFVCLFPNKNYLQFESREDGGDWDGVSAVETVSSSVAQLVSHSVSKDDLELLSDPISDSGTAVSGLCGVRFKFGALYMLSKHSAY